MVIFMTILGIIGIFMGLYSAAQGSITGEVVFMLGAACFGIGGIIEKLKQISDKI